MRLSDLDVIRCPKCGGYLRALGAPTNGAISDGALACRGCSARFNVEKSIPRLVSGSLGSTTYDISFAAYENVQLDRFNGTQLARGRFTRLVAPLKYGQEPRRVLQAGCGSGRYTEAGVGPAVDLWAVDLSAIAVEACRSNLGSAEQLHVLQADIHELPFGPDTFDIIYSLGVLMAVPSPLKALTCLRRHLKPGGWLVVDIYRWRARQLLDPRVWLRPLTARLPRDWLWKACTIGVPALWPLSRALGRVPKAGPFLRHLIPICNYDGLIPLRETAQRAFSLVDTFDFLGARHSHRVTERRFRSWLDMAGFVDIEVLPEGMMAARARKPSSG